MGEPSQHGRADVEGEACNMYIQVNRHMLIALLHTPSSAARTRRKGGGRAGAIHAHRPTCNGQEQAHTHTHTVTLDTLCVCVCVESKGLATHSFSSLAAAFVLACREGRVLTVACMEKVNEGGRSW
jgi:hypothetical protein